MQHEWVKSNLGHGEAMCKNCKITNREAAVLGTLNDCDCAPCVYCGDEPEPGFIEMENNGPIVPCPLCNSHSE